MMCDRTSESLPQQHDVVNTLTEHEEDLRHMDSDRGTGSNADSKFDSNADSKTNDMQQKLAAVRTMFAAKLPARLGAIDSALQACRDAPGQSAEMEELHRLLHGLGGAAGTFGFDALGRQARAFEGDVQQWLTAGACSERDLDRLAWQLPQLQMHLQQPLDMGPPSEAAPEPQA